MGYVMLVEAQHQRSGERGCKRPADRGELKSMPGEGSRRGKSDAHKDFPSQHEGAEQLGPGCANILAHRKRRRRHHRSGMHDGGGMSAVILKRVHQRAVAQRCRRRCNRSREAEAPSICLPPRTPRPTRSAADSEAVTRQQGPRPIGQAGVSWPAQPHRPEYRRSGSRAYALRPSVPAKGDGRRLARLWSADRPAPWASRVVRQTRCL